ncbi:hypothetical protein AOQ84DRAFT_52300 [Glonium stellatum]|uniref:Uncharacterized protein n=1 Tax=Glonium stellatum TaxID=574774 RepID=A0A8E2EZK8_9PEZI|nr:hypothetical protein AOQ84DRAFT_52300 [Glonium stellatum]
MCLPLLCSEVVCGESGKLEVTLRHLRRHEAVRSPEPHDGARWVVRMITEPFLETITSGPKRTAWEAKASIPACFGDTVHISVSRCGLVGGWERPARGGVCMIGICRLFRAAVALSLLHGSRACFVCQHSALGTLLSLCFCCCCRTVASSRTGGCCCCCCCCYLKRAN